MTRSVDISLAEQTAFFRGVDTRLLREMFSRKNLDTPVLLLSAAEVSRNYDALRRALPRAGIHYAVKSNNHPALLREVYDRGGNFDICSAGEVDEILKLGIDPATLIHSHPVKAIGELDRAVGKGVETFVVDNTDEIKKLARYSDTKLKILVRYRINTNTSAVINLQYKFGCAVDEVLPLARLIEKAGHDFYGLCCHIGSQCIYSENYVKTITVAQKLIHELTAAGLDTRILDIGGGFPVEYVDPLPAIEEFCAPINDALDKLVRPGIRVVCEPGRFISASPVTLVCSVIGKAFRDGKLWYYLDDGLYSTFSGIVYDRCQYPVVTDRQGPERLSVLAGPTCDSSDVMYDGLMVPEHDIGDVFVFPLTGAYCSVSGSDFNSMNRPEYKVIR
jgi:ornithine decarboxylase